MYNRINDPSYDFKIADRRTGNIPLTTVVFNAHEYFLRSPIFPDYWVGNYGTIYQISTGMLLSKSETRGYLKVRMVDGLGKEHNIGVHRAVMIVHAYRPDYPNLTVNHKDRNKKNNYYNPFDPNSNLEWCSNLENSHHYVVTENSNLPEYSQKSVYSDDQIREVCRGVINGMDMLEISAVSGIETYKLAAVISSLKRRVYRKNIVDNEFPNLPYPNRNPNQYTEDDVRQICELLQNKMTCENVVIEMRNRGIDVSISFVYSIKNNKPATQWKNIVAEYNIEKNNTRFDWSDDTIDAICRMYISGSSHSEIIAKLGLDDGLHSRSSITSMITSLTRNNTAKYRHITSKYFSDTNIIEIDRMRRGRDEYTDEIKDKIVQLCRKGLSANKIVDILASQNIMITKSFVYRLRSIIAKDHPEYDINLQRYDIDDDVIDKACQMLQNNIPYTSIVKSLNLPPTRGEGAYRALFLRLKRNEVSRYIHISSKYFPMQ